MNNIPKDFDPEEIARFLESNAPFIADKQFILKFKGFSASAMDFALFPFEEMTCKTLEFGSVNELSLGHVQARDYVFAYVGNDGCIELVKTDTFEVGFNDKFVTYAENSVIVLKQVNYAKFEGLKVGISTSKALQNYEELIQEGNIGNSLVLLNQNLDYFSYKAKGSIKLMEIRGKYLHLILKTNNKASMLKIGSIIDKIPKSTEVALEIDLNSEPSSYFYEALEKCASSLRIVKFVIYCYIHDLNRMLAKDCSMLKILSQSSLREFEHHPFWNGKDIYFVRSIDHNDWSPQTFIDGLTSTIDTSDKPLRYNTSEDYSDYISIR